MSGESRHPKPPLPPHTPPSGWQPITPPDRPQASGGLTPQNKRLLKIIGAGFAVFLVAAVALRAAGIGDPEGASGRNSAADLDAQQYSAHAACAEFTRDRLKSPSSADFPEYDDPGVSIRHVGNTWTVVSFVDADNSFGASLRTDFVCVVEDRGDTWRLESWVDG